MYFDVGIDFRDKIVEHKGVAMSENQETSAKRRPWHMWVVGVLGLLWNAMGAMDYIMTETRNEAYLSSFSPEQLEFFNSFPAWVVASWATAVWGGVLGALLLLFRRRLAVPVFLVSLVAMLITTFHNFVLSNGLEVMGDGFALGFTVVIFLVSLGLLLYSCAMRQRGVLV